MVDPDEDAKSEGAESECSVELRAGPSAQRTGSRVSYRYSLLYNDYNLSTGADFPSTHTGSPAAKDYEDYLTEETIARVVEPVRLAVGELDHPAEEDRVTETVRSWESPVLPRPAVGSRLPVVAAAAAAEKEEEEGAGAGEGRRWEPARSWVVLVAACLCNANIVIPEVTFAVFYEDLLSLYGVNHGQLGWTISIMWIGALCTGLFASAGVCMVGCRPVAVSGAVVATVAFALAAFSPNIICLYLTYGLLGGIGFGTVWLCNAIIIQQHFDRNRGLATGLVTLGFGAGIVLGPVLAEFLQQEYGVRGAMLLIAAAHAQNIIFTSLFSPCEQQQWWSLSAEKEPTCHLQGAVADNTLSGEGPLVFKLDSSGAPHKDNKPRQPGRLQCKECGNMIKLIFVNAFDLSTVKNLRFALFCIAGSLVAFCIVAYMQHCPSRAIQLGFARTDSAYLLSAYGTTISLVRVVTSVITNGGHVNIFLYYLSGCIFCTIGSLCISLGDNYVALVIGSIFFGMLEGVTFTVTPLVIVQLLGADCFPKAYALFSFSRLPCIMLGAPLTGWLFDVYRTYTVAFLVVSAAGLSSIVIMLAVYAIDRRVQMRITRELCAAPPLSESDSDFYSDGPGTSSSSTR